MNRRNHFWIITINPHSRSIWLITALKAKGGESVVTRIRRYQNPDGTYTSAGKKRYSASAKEQLKSSAKIQQAKRLHGVSRQTAERDDDAKHLSWLKSVTDEDYGKSYELTKENGYTKDDVQEFHQNEIREYADRVKSGEIFIRNSALMEARLDSIDVSSTRYRDVKKLVKQIINEMINDSISEEFKRQ